MKILRIIRLDMKHYLQGTRLAVRLCCSRCSAAFALMCFTGELALSPQAPVLRRHTPCRVPGRVSNCCAQSPAFSRRTAGADEQRLYADAWHVAGEPKHTRLERHGFHAHPRPGAETWILTEEEIE